MKDFKKLDIWKFGMKLTTEAYRITKTFPKTESFGLTSQFRRAATSVPLNIAEGNGRSSDKEKLRFMEFSLGSLNELETLLLVSVELGFVSSSEFGTYLDMIYKEQKMLTGFMNTLRASG